MKRSWFFIILLTVISLALAGISAYFSIYGISKLFHVDDWSIIIMAASLEAAKLASVSYLYRYWEIISKFWRTYLSIGTVVVMLITSLGIYGFLSSTYQKTANKVELRDAKIKIAENKKLLFSNQLDRINKSIETDDSRINKMSDIRNQQENRITSLYSNRSTTSARRTETQINSTNTQMEILSSSIAEKMKQSNAINDSISAYDQNILELKMSDVSDEIGTFKYLSDLTGYPMNKVVNILILLIIFVFDPMAIALLISVNQLTMMDKPVPNHKTDTIDVPKIFKRKKKIVKENINSDRNIVENEDIDNEEDEISDDVEEEIIEEIDDEHEEFIDDEDDVFVDENKIETIIDLDKSNIRDGMIIYHDVYGRGKVLNKNLNRVLIKFDGFGIKEMDINFAKLKEVGVIDISKVEDSNTLDTYQTNLKDLDVKLVQNDMKDTDSNDMIEDEDDEELEEDGEEIDIEEIVSEEDIPTTPEYETVKFIDPNSYWLVQEKRVLKNPHP